MTQIEILKKNIQEAEAIIVGGASGLSAAAGFRFYYMSDATFKQIAGQLGEKYHADGFFPAGVSSANQERGTMGSIAPRVQILV